MSPAQRLMLEIQDCLHEAQATVDRIVPLLHTLGSENHFESEQVDEEDKVLRRQLRAAHVAMCLLLETLNLPQLLEQFKAEFAQIDLGQIDPNDGIHFTSPAVVLCSLYLGALPTGKDQDIDLERELQQEFVARVLRNVPRIIAHRRASPRKEADVHDLIYETLSYIFPDVQKHVLVNQITKNYKMDVGIRSIKTAIEVKFANSLAEAKAEVDQLYADMKAYQGEEWEKFFALIYSPVPHFSQEQLDAQLKMVDADPRWTAIVVHGPGGR